MRREDDDWSERKGCGVDDSLTVNEEEPDEWLEETVWYGLRMWHVIFLSIGIALSIVILLCCCFKFRIPRTKQEIEGDYVRRRIMRKFRKRLKAIQNQELDEMDLKKALDKIRTELKSDTESLQQSDVLSGGTLSSAGLGAGQGSTYRRASQIQIDISLEDLRIQSMGLGARIALALSRLFRRGRGGPQGQDTAMEEGNANNTPEGADKPTTALLSPQGDATQQLTEDESSKTKSKKKKDKSKPEPSSSSTPASKENTNTAYKDKETTKKSQPTIGKETKSNKAKGKSTESDKDKNKDTQISKTDKSSTASGSTGKGKAAGGDTTSSKKQTTSLLKSNLNNK